MKKFSIYILFIIIVSLVTSCGIDQTGNKDLNEDKNLVEKPKEEIAIEKEVVVEGVEEQQQEQEEIENDKDNKDEDTPKDNEQENKEELEKNDEQEIEKDTEEIENKDIEQEKDSLGKNANVAESFGKKNEATTVALKTLVLNIIEKKGYITVDDLNVRTLGSMKGRILTDIDRGVEVHIFGEKNNWYYVEYAKNKRGWVYSRYIQFERIKSSPIDTSSLSNKSYNWYFIRNNKHDQPGFDKSYKKMLGKYEGIAIGNKNKKDIFLTFDNGYENGYTNKILDILKRQNIKVGFFVQGTYIDKNPEIVRRMVKEGHIVLNHTNNHPQMPTLSKEKLVYEINVVAEKYKKVTGQEMLKLIRPPSGAFSERTLAEARNLGYRSVFWSMAYRDWVVNDQPGKQAAYKHVTDNIHNGAVILLHSVSKSNTEALEDIIKELKRQGYEFKLLTQYP